LSKFCPNFPMLLIPKKLPNKSHKSETGKTPFPKLPPHQNEKRDPKTYVKRPIIFFAIEAPLGLYRCVWTFCKKGVGE
jgi:hypothetical protein